MSEETGDVGAALRVANAIADAEISVLGHQQRPWLRALCIQGVGAILAGASGDLPRLLVTTPGVVSSDGPSLIFGTGVRTRALDTAFVNATSAGAAHGGLGLLLSALVALAEERQINGASLMSALLAAKRAEALFGGIAVSSAAGVCRLLTLDAQRTANALGLAHTSSEAQTTGSLAAPAGARMGLLAGLIAEQGGTPSSGLILANLGLFREVEAIDAELLCAQPTSSDGDLWEQFEAAAKHSLPRDRIAPVFERLETLDKIEDMRTLTRLLQSSEIGRPEPTKVTFAARGTHEPQETTWVP